MSLSVALNRLPGYGDALPNFDYVPSQYRALIGSQIRFPVNFTVREGARGQDFARAMFGTNSVEVGYSTDAQGNLVAKSSATLQGVAPTTGRRQALEIRLSKGSNAQVGGAATSLVVSPVR